MSASALIRAAPALPCAPWPRHRLAPAEWAAMAEALAAEPGLALRAMWADTGHVHALFQDEPAGRFLPASAPVERGTYAALSPHRPAAAWFERCIRDLWGHAAADGVDDRPWLDHGRWANHAPLALRPVPSDGAPEPPLLLPGERAGLHQVPIGPVRGGIAEAGHFRLTVQGETVLRLESRLGYLHKGTLALMRGKSPRAAARFAARLAGESTVAHATAFARAAEAATATEAPGRAAALRAAMGEMERIAGHLADLGAIIGEAGLAPLALRFGWHREAMLRAASIAFGHRLMMDLVVPGGVAADIAPDGAEAIGSALAALTAELPELAGAYDASASLAERVGGIGRVTAELARAFAPGGCIGRAAGRAADLRRLPGYPPYDALNFDVPVLAEGDVDARARLRLAELRQSAALLSGLLRNLPEGPVSLLLPPESGEGFGWAEGPRGDVWHWLSLDGGMIAACFPRDPAWLHWPLLEAAATGGALADVPLCAASFGCSVAGVDS